MASSITRRICRSALFSKPSASHPSMSFCTTGSGDSAPRSDEGDSKSSPVSSQSSAYGGLLESGVENGIYKAILVGQVGRSPIQKILKNGRKIVSFPVGTGGIRNNRTPLMHEDPKEHGNSCTVQWHRVCIYQESLVDMAMKHVLPGSILYLEGNLETRVYPDSITGIARRVREIAIHRDGRIVFIGKVEGRQFSTAELKGVGYF